MYNAKKDSIGNVREQVLSKCWQYLLVNFDKFSDANKIKIALALGQKSMPTELNQTITVNKMGEVEIGGRVKEFILG